MKKIVTLGAIAVLSAGFMFADEPAADVSITEFKGDAKVTWGMDLDAGKTGFKNTESANFKVNLFSKGEKVTEGEGVWAELKIKTEGLKLENGEWKEGKASVDAATLHFNDFFVGIRSGDANVGKYQYDAAIRSKDKDASTWVTDIGPDGIPSIKDKYLYKYGIQAGYDTSDLAVKFDLRSLTDKDAKNTQYTNSYAVALEGELKDSNQWLEGLFVKAGFGYNLSGEFYQKKDLGTEDDLKDGKKQYEFDADTGDKKVKQKAKTGDSPVERKWLTTLSDSEVKQYKLNGVQNGHLFGYGASLGYKYKLDDTYFVKPAVAFAGATYTSDVNYGDNKWGKVSENGNYITAGAIFGWGDTEDANAGVYYLDNDDKTKKVTPGISIVADIPLATTSTITTDKTYKNTTHSALLAVISPAFYSGSIVENLKAAVYSEIGLYRYKDDPDTKAEISDASYTKTSGNDTETWANANWKDDKFAFALAAAVKYDIKSDDITVTPQVGFRFVNHTYVENKTNERYPLSVNPVFTDLGTQKKIRDPKNDKVKYGKGDDKHFEGDFFNLKAGVEVGGLINNTTFDLVYESANLLNKTNYSSEKVKAREVSNVDSDTDIDNPNYNAGWKWYNVKLGHFDIGCKIAF